MEHRRIPLPPEVTDLYQAVDNLTARFPGRPFTPDGHLIGSIGEVVAKEAFHLTLYEPGKPVHDAYDENGDVQIKFTAGTHVSMYSCCDRLLVLQLLSPREADVVYDGPGQPAWENAGPLQKNGQRKISLSKLRELASAGSAATECVERNSIDPFAFTRLVDPTLHERSGKVFYSGTAAFSSRSPVYVLGLNPGGCPSHHVQDTIGRDLSQWRSRPAHWSSYADESWEGEKAGTYGMAPRVLHLFKSLQLDAHDVPASNVVFVRTSNEADLAKDKKELLKACWPVHEAIIGKLGVSTILCFGGTAGRWVRGLLEAKERIAEFKEMNERGWLNEAHISSTGTCVVTLTHPSRADWRNPATDPSDLVRKILNR